MPEREVRDVRAEEMAARGGGGRGDCEDELGEDDGDDGWREAR